MSLFLIFILLSFSFVNLVRSEQCNFDPNKTISDNCPGLSSRCTEAVSFIYTLYIIHFVSMHVSSYTNLTSLCVPIPFSLSLTRNYVPLVIVMLKKELLVKMVDILVHALQVAPL